MIILQRIQIERVLLKLAIIAGLVGIILYLTLLSHHISITSVKNVGSATLSPVDCSKNPSHSTVALNHSSNQPDACLFTGCSGFFQ